ncbi:MAG: BolA family transcriptional regulator [Gammaproteobacteria bacterium]|nr:MAG: BolA family transcriptional regulator [Gammaproteobacteria bacterium]
MNSPAASRPERIRARLEAAFAPARVVVTDDSARHAGHAGARGGAGHFLVRIESQAFSGRTRLERHRLVYGAVADMMPAEIHALNIEALSPDDHGVTTSP